MGYSYIFNRYMFSDNSVESDPFVFGWFSKWNDSFISEMFNGWNN